MNLRRLYGPDYRDNVMIAGLSMRSITTDIETLTDALDYALTMWDSGHTLRDRGATVIDRFEVPSRSGDLTREDLADMGVLDRNNLTLSRELHDPAEQLDPIRRVSISCARANVQMESPLSSQEGPLLVDFIQKNSTPRPTWSRLRHLFPYLALIPILIGYVGTIATQPLTPFAHLLLLSIVVLATAATWKWSETLRPHLQWATGSILVRPHSRQKTNADRASTHANIRVSVITAIILLPLSIGGTILTTWLTQN